MREPPYAQQIGVWLSGWPFSVYSSFSTQRQRVRRKLFRMDKSERKKYEKTCNLKTQKVKLFQSAAIHCHWICRWQKKKKYIKKSLCIILWHVRYIYIKKKLEKLERNAFLKVVSNQISMSIHVTGTFKCWSWSVPQFQNRSVNRGESWRPCCLYNNVFLSGQNSPLHTLMRCKCPRGSRFGQDRQEEERDEMVCRVIVCLCYSPPG